ncbi:MAG: hypothetical protein IPL78_00720 [Chloroflexi bacterium]|nr:hypothetical protein [Chloroflexota bacterium]
MAQWLRPLINRRWRWLTVVVILGITLLIRLGIWQLDRLDERRASNAVLVARIKTTRFCGHLTYCESTPDLLAMKRSNETWPRAIRLYHCSSSNSNRSKGKRANLVTPFVAG